ncbi:MAG: hypothetical protein JOZ46_01115 [Candidatus Dormibacteraeota bacterium]|nr:hypothetical protein [Candidatus Dormibacteraeota bacterium]MBV9524393.1 hypothetical protein [Candidatus Dormibacteraeota bacterium]
MSGEAESAAVAARRRRSLRCRVERLVLGSIMSVIAAVLDRRLRRVFARR